MLHHVSPPEVMLVCLIVVVFGGCVLDLITSAVLYRSLARVEPADLALARGAVWLASLPCVGCLFYFYTVPRVVESLERAQRSTSAASRSARRVGTWYAVARAVTLVPCLNLISAPVALILLGVFLLKVSDLASGRAGAV